MTCYHFEWSHWWKIHFWKKVLYKICFPVWMLWFQPMKTLKLYLVMWFITWLILTNSNWKPRRWIWSVKCVTIKITGKSHQKIWWSKLCLLNFFYFKHYTNEQFYILNMKKLGKLQISLFFLFVHFQIFAVYVVANCYLDPNIANFTRKIFDF